MMYVFVKVYGLIVQDVEIFDDEKMAEASFKDYTGYDYAEFNKQDENYPLDENYDQCKIFELKDEDINSKQFTYQWTKMREALTGFKG